MERSTYAKVYPATYMVRNTNARWQTYIGHVLVSVNPFRDREFDRFSLSTAAADNRQWEFTQTKSSIPIADGIVSKSHRTYSQSPNLHTTT
jgi:hypothetical protein